MLSKCQSLPAFSKTTDSRRDWWPTNYWSKTCSWIQTIQFWYLWLSCNMFVSSWSCCKLTFCCWTCWLRDLTCSWSERFLCWSSPAIDWKAFKIMFQATAVNNYFNGTTSKYTCIRCWMSHTFITCVCVCVCTEVMKRNYTRSLAADMQGLKKVPSGCRDK